MTEQEQKAELDKIRYRKALQRILAEAMSDDGLAAWDAGDIAREALKDDQ